jgi:hypothetical protein
MHLGAVAGLGLAVAEIEAFADLDRAMRAAWSPTGDVAFSPTFSGGWKPITL